MSCSSGIAGMKNRTDLYIHCALPDRFEALGGS